MADLVTPTPVVLDVPRSLLFTNRAILACERELSKLWGTKTSMWTTLSQAETLGINDLSVMLWAGLLHEQHEPGKPKLVTLEDVQEAMDMRRQPELLGAVLEAWNAATLRVLPVTDEEANGPLVQSVPAPSSTGPASGASDASPLALVTTNSGG
jgi:hypothetical protein